MKYFLLIAAIFCSVLSFAQTAQQFYDKAEQLYEQTDFTNALNQVNKALANDSTNLDYLLLKANSLFKLNEYKNSFTLFSKIIYLYPSNVRALNNRGILLGAIREFEYSIKDFDRALELEKIDTQKVALYVNRGSSKSGLRDFEGAYKDFMLAYQIDSLNIGTLNNLATTCDEVGKGNETLKYLFKILDIDSSFIGTYVNIGFKYQEDGNFSGAIEYFTKALQIDPEEALAYSNRSFNYYKLGDYKSALKDADHAIELYPANSFAFKNRALIFIAKKEFKKACTDLERAIELGFTQMYGPEVDELKVKHCTSSKL